MSLVTNPSTARTAWHPQPRQAEALVRTEQEILYGGARGGGKTDAGMAWLLYPIMEKKYPRYRALVIRRNADDLKDWIDRAGQMYANLGGKATGMPSEFKFPGGEIIRTGHLKDADAYTKYQGHEYQKILIEELTHIPREGDYEKLLGSNRTTIDGLMPQTFATTNPDGPGYKWVKTRFNIPDEPTGNVVINAMGRSRVFIPAKLADNQILEEKDPAYRKYLETLGDPDLRDAWLNGSWAGISVEGAYYIKALSESRAKGRVTSMPWDKNQRVHTYWDIGRRDDTTIGFFQFVGNQINMIDYYVNRGYGADFYAKVVLDKPYIYEMHHFPHDVNKSEYGTNRTIKETMENLLNHKVEVVRKIEINDGINALRMIFNRLWFDKDNCHEALEALGQYRREFDDRKGAYKDTPFHDWTSHCADMMRYLAVDYENIAGNIDTTPDEFPHFNRSKEFAKEMNQPKSRFHYTN